MILYKKDCRTALKNGDIIRGILTKQYIVNREIARGGFSIVYDVCEYADGAKSSIHYILKEYYPRHLDESIKRNENNFLLCIRNEAQFREGLEKFLQEQTLQNTIFPPSNSEEGIYFFYQPEAFEANETAYIVSQTEYCESFYDAFLGKETIDLKSIAVSLRDVCKALAILHEKNILHGDISDRNIMLCQGRTKLIDFGNSLPIYRADDTPITQVKSYTQGFAPPEIIASTQTGKPIPLNASVDTYSVCALLFRSLLGEYYQSGIHGNNSKLWIKNLAANQQVKAYGKQTLEQIMQILSKGLKSSQKRYQSAIELANELTALIKIMEIEKTERHDRKTKWTIAISIVLTFALFCFNLFIFTPAPKASFRSEIGDVYAQDDEITFSVEVSDEDISKGIWSVERAKEGLELQGFSADVDITTRQLAGNTSLIFDYTLRNITSENDGEKAIFLENIYRKHAGIFTKTHKSLEETFLYVNENIEIDISDPSFTKISNNWNTVSYDISISAPTGFVGNLDDITVNGFSCDSFESELLFENTYRLTFHNIIGDVGKCRFEIPEGAYHDAYGRKNHSTTSPSFEIMAKSISNLPTKIFLDIEESKLYQGGYAVVSYTVNQSSYTSALTEENIHLIGCSGIVKLFEGRIIVRDLSFEEQNTDTIGLSIDAGIIRSNHNGSVNMESKCAFSDIKQDTTPPSVVVSRTDVGDTVSFVLHFNDESGQVKVQENLEPYLAFHGFTFQDMKIIKITSTDYLILFTNIEISALYGAEENEIFMALRYGAAVDPAGNASKVTRIPLKVSNQSY